MTNFDDFIKWEYLSNDTIDFKKAYVDMTGDLMAGLALSSLVYWYLPSKFGKNKLRVMHEGKYWIACQYKEWWDRCRLTESQAERAIKILQEAGIIEKKVFRFNGLATVHIRINEVKFLELLDAQTKLADENEQDDGTVSATTETGLCQNRNRSLPEQRPLTETLTENININENSEKKFLQKTKSEYAERLRGIVDKSFTRSGEDSTDFPEDVRELSDAFCKLWNFVPPTKSKATASKFQFWIKCLYELKDACGEFGVSVLHEIRKEFVSYMETHGGVAPFNIYSPGSLVNAARGRAALMRGSNQDNNKVVFPTDGSGGMYL